MEIFDKADLLIPRETHEKYTDLRTACIFPARVHASLRDSKSELEAALGERVFSFGM